MTAPSATTAKPRVLSPELIDELAADHPDAMHCRRDLKFINRIMGNFSWLKKSLKKRGLLDGDARIVELGAGDGTFAELLLDCHPELEITAVDLAPRPGGLPDRIDWNQGDVFDILPGLEGDVVIVNLFLHHFTGEQLARLGDLIRPFGTLIANEPIRTGYSHVFGFLGSLIGFSHVTRADLHVSIDAGFVGKELVDLLGLDDWDHSIDHTLMGAHRLIADSADSAG